MLWGAGVGGLAGCSHSIWKQEQVLICVKMRGEIQEREEGRSKDGGRGALREGEQE